MQIWSIQNVPVKSYSELKINDQKSKFFDGGPTLRSYISRSERRPIEIFWICSYPHRPYRKMKKNGGSFSSGGSLQPSNLDGLAERLLIEKNLNFKLIKKLFCCIYTIIILTIILRFFGNKIVLTWFSIFFCANKSNKYYTVM